MARDTDTHLRNKVLYSVFVRNHTKEGTLRAIEDDLDRIQELGTDYVWLLPIHPIGEVNRKGNLGSPYAIKDYRFIDPTLGTEEDFQHLVEEIHKRGMGIIMDVVYNHTSPDSLLAKEHPEWFYQDRTGSPSHRFVEWTDVIDLDYNNVHLWNYQIETLKYWATIVDGFRCDCASVIPIDFWLLARKEVEEVNPTCIWVAETMYPDYIFELRDEGFYAASDSEVYAAFDATYDYDSRSLMEGYLNGIVSFESFLMIKQRQEVQYPENYIKLRFLENHDQKRVQTLVKSERALLNWTAFLYFEKGMTLIQAGQEKGILHTTSLFNKDPLVWEKKEGIDLTWLFKKLEQLKVEPTFSSEHYHLTGDKDCASLYGYYQKGEDRWVGIFCLRGAEVSMLVDIPDGTYRNLLNNEDIFVEEGRVSLQGMPLIFKAKAPPKRSELVYSPYKEQVSLSAREQTGV